VREKLTVGKTGQVKLYWKSAGSAEVKTASILKAVTEVPALSEGTFKFIEGADQAIKDAVAKNLTVFDLRNSGFGNFPVAERALAALLPQGNYGFTTSERNEKQLPFALKGSGGDLPMLTLKVDRSTLGAARFFASVMKASGKATLEGDLGPEPVFIFETVGVQGGAGYVIPTAIYKAEEAAS
jgi:C-terminal processing protease CtpA/Prc